MSRTCFFILSSLLTIFITSCSSTSKNIERTIASGKEFEPAINVILVSEKPVWGHYLVLTPVLNGHAIELGHEIPEGHAHPGYVAPNFKYDVFVGTCLLKNQFEKIPIDQERMADLPRTLKVTDLATLVVGGGPVPGMKSGYMLEYRESVKSKKIKILYMYPSPVPLERQLPMSRDWCYPEQN